MRKLGFLGAMVILSSVAWAVDPKVGATISFIGKANWQTYISNGFFKERPITLEMAKEGIDLCWYGGKRKDETWQKSLTQFNAIWLNTEHEDECPYPAAEMSKALAEYVKAGGGLVVCHSAGRYAEAPVDAYWHEVFKVFGAEILHEEIADFTEIEYIPKRDIFFCDTFAKHPVTEGVPGLWLPLRKTRKGEGGAEWGSVAVKYSPEWKVIVSTTPAGRSYKKNRITNDIRWIEENVGYYKSSAPIVAVREFGKGRIVFIAIHKDNAAWAYNINRWCNRTERSVIKGKRTDAVRLVENALKWVSEPSLGEAGFVNHYRPYEMEIPPYKRIQDFGLRWEEQAKWVASVGKDVTSAARGIIGAHSAHSDGESTVAEYVAAAKQAGLNFIVFTDPLENLTAEKLASLRADCAAASGKDFFACPGVEYTDLAGLRWLVFHDKVEFPKPGKFIRDGRSYEIFDGKTVLQRGRYGGQNLYRGAVINGPRLKEAGIDVVNLTWYNWVIPKAYDIDQLLYDNEEMMLQAPMDMFRVGTISYTRVRRATDVARAAAASVTCVDTLEKARDWLNQFGGERGNRKATAYNEWVRCGGKAELRTFDFVRVPGTDVIRCTLCASSPDGLSEVKVVDGHKRILARFDCQGKTEFSTTFSFIYDAQSFPQAILTDAKGNRSYSVQKWLHDYHAGMHRCGDNLNLLSQNPNVIFHPNWDDQICPPFKYLCRPKDHFEISEANFWQDSAPSMKPWTEVDRLRTSRIHMKGIDYPSEEKDVMPSSRTVFTLNQPNAVFIIDQFFGERTVNAVRTAKRSTYCYCSPQTTVGENPYWRHNRRVYQFVDQHDGWWMAVYRQRAPDYRGGYSIVEGKVEFLTDVTLSEPVSLAEMISTDPRRGKVDVYRTPGRDFAAGAYYSAVADPTAWYGYFVLKGSDALGVGERKVSNGLCATLTIGETGRTYRKGDTLTYRFAFGSFVEDPRNGAYLDWFAGMMDGSRFNHEASKGEVVDVNGILELKANRGVAEVSLGPTWFIQRYPVRIRGLVDNGTAVMTDGAKIVKPLAFENGLAYAEVPLELKKTWFFGNLYVAKDKNVRMCYLPAMPGHEKAELQLHNPTEKVLRTKVVNIRSGESFDVEIPAGAMVVR